MNTAKPDRRVKYTKMVLRESLIDLMRDSDVSKITVTSLCERADINRGTFYSYYNDPAELLMRIEDELYGEINATLDKHMTNGGGERESAFNSRVTLREIFSCLAENRELCMVLLGKHGDQDFLLRILNIGRERFVADWSRAFGGGDIATFEKIYSFVVSGAMGVVREWSANGMREEPELIADFVDRMTREGIMGFAADKNGV